MIVVLKASFSGNLSTINNVNVFKFVPYEKGIFGDVTLQIGHGANFREEKHKNVLIEEIKDSDFVEY